MSRPPSRRSGAGWLRTPARMHNGGGDQGRGRGRADTLCRRWAWKMREGLGGGGPGRGAPFWAGGRLQAQAGRSAGVRITWQCCHEILEPYAPQTPSESGGSADVASRVLKHVAPYATSGASASCRDTLGADSDLRAYGTCHRRDGKALCTAAIAAGIRFLRYKIVAVGYNRCDSAEPVRVTSL
jgi:hypothetical protein